MTSVILGNLSKPRTSRSELFRIDYNSIRNPLDFMSKAIVILPAYRNPNSGKSDRILWALCTSIGKNGQVGYFRPNLYALTVEKNNW